MSHLSLLDTISLSLSGEGDSVAWGGVRVGKTLENFVER